MLSMCQPAMHMQCDEQGVVDAIFSLLLQTGQVEENYKQTYIDRYIRTE